MPPARNPPGALSSLPRRRRGLSRIRQAGRSRGRRGSTHGRRGPPVDGPHRGGDGPPARFRRRADRRAGAGEPSLLPGWTRGHVLTHVARNADGLGNLLRWARTGAETPMYASREARRADIEAGAGRSAADLAADVQATAIGFAAEAASLPDEAWAAQVRALTGPPIPARSVLDWRLREVEIHHVDLAAGYRPGDWPAEFVTAQPARGRRSVRGPGRRAALPAPAGRLRPRTATRSARSSPPRPQLLVHGPPAEPAGLADRPGRRQRAAGLRRWRLPCRCCPRGGRRPATPIRCAEELDCSPRADKNEGETVAYTGDVTVGGPPDTRELPGLTVTKLAVGPDGQQRLPAPVHPDRRRWC